MNDTLYSQNKEEQHILDYFKDVNTGFFIEIGGYNPFTFSNTRALVEKGWFGVYVEPSPTCMDSFKKEYAGNDKIELLELAITPTPQGRMKFYDSGGDAISSLDTAHVDKWTKGSNVKYKEIEVETLSMEFLLQRYAMSNCRFLNLDVEGINIDLFRAIPDWFLEQISLICIEHDTHDKEITERLSNFGFKGIYFNGENIIMAK